MAQFTLTLRQRKAIGLLLEQTLKEQDAVATYAASLASGKTRRDSCHSDLEQAMAEIGKATGTVRGLTKDLEPDGTWAGKITVT